MIDEKNLNATNLPIRPFMYTLDQISMMTGISEIALTRTHLHFEGRTPGYKQRWQLACANIAPPDDKPDWRVVDREFIRWLKVKGFRVIERGYVAQ